MDWKDIALGLYAVVIGILGWIGRNLFKKVEDNAEEISKLKTELALNKQNDEKLSESIEKIEKSLQSIDDHLRKYDFVLQKALKKEMEGP